VTEEYNMDLELFSLAQLQQLCEAGDLLPSERILGEEVAARFAVLESMGITHLAGLTRALSTKKKLQRFSQQSGLPVDYLTILRRRAGFYAPRPVQLAQLPGIDPEHVACLAGLGIKDSRQLFGRGRSERDRELLAYLAGVPDNAILELVKLSDLVRAPFVGPVYARLFYEAGFDTLEKLAASAPEELVAGMHAANEEKKLTRAALPTSAAEMASFLEIVRMIPFVVEY
jgi:hypothetical protein